METDAIPGELGEGQSYEQTARRIYRNIAIVTAAGCVAAFPISGWQAAVSFLIGAAAAYFNFSWLHKAVSAIGPNARPTKNRIFVLISLRYLFLLGIGYVIVKVFGMKAIAALIGLFVPIAAILLEVLSRALTALFGASGAETRQ